MDLRRKPRLEHSWTCWSLSRFVTAPRISSFLLFAVCIIALSCAKPNRVSPGLIAKLTKKREPFVMVFGSLTTPKGALDRPSIHFLHPENGTAKDELLLSLTILSGDRFYAILNPPPEAAYLDGFYTEVGSDTTGFDRIIYVRIREGQAPVAIYVGEISVTPAAERARQGQKVVVEARDDLQNAQQELRKLYPGFEGTVIKGLPVRSQGPPQPTPTRVK